MKRQIPIHTHYANGEPTHWPEMILAEIVNNKHSSTAEHCFELAMNNPLMDNDFFKSDFPQEKKHHIMPLNFECDLGDDVEFMAVTPGGDEFKFAPLVKCKGIQVISIMPFEKMGLTIIDRGHIIPAVTEVEVAKNEGFDSVEHWYSNVPFENDWKIWKGGIIHWTDKQYK